VTGEVFSTTSGADGVFSFDAAKQGTYVLHIEGGLDRDYAPTDLLIKLDATSATDDLTLSREAQGCGGAAIEFRYYQPPSGRALQ
jgi:hypothetical protein